MKITFRCFCGSVPAISQSKFQIKSRLTNRNRYLVSPFYLCLSLELLFLFFSFCFFTLEMKFTVVCLLFFAVLCASQMSVKKQFLAEVFLVDFFPFAILRRELNATRTPRRAFLMTSRCTSSWFLTLTMIPVGSLLLISTM